MGLTGIGPVCVVKWSPNRSTIAVQSYREVQKITVGWRRIIEGMQEYASVRLKKVCLPHVGAVGVVD